MSGQDVNMITAVIAGVVTVIPFALTLVAARAGYRQVREFHERTGDDSLLASITAFSRFHDEIKPKQVGAKATRKEPEGAY